MNANTHAPFPTLVVGNGFLFPNRQNNATDNTIHVQSRRWVGRSDRTCFFTDMQVSSPTAPEMSVKKLGFLHRLSNVTEGS